MIIHQRWRTEHCHVPWKVMQCYCKPWFCRKSKSRKAVDFWWIEWRWMQFSFISRSRQKLILTMHSLVCWWKERKWEIIYSEIRDFILGDSNLTTKSNSMYAKLTRYFFDSSSMHNWYRINHTVWPIHHESYCMTPKDESTMNMILGDIFP